MIKNAFFRGSAAVLVIVLFFALTACGKNKNNQTEVLTELSIDFGAGGWLKGDTHFHTKYSDGSATMEQMFALAKEKGYDFLNISDHNNINGWEDAKKFGRQHEIVPIPGTEYTRWSDAGHATFMNATRNKNYAAGDSVQNDIAAFRKDADSGLVIANHPFDDGANNWLWNYWDADIDGMEVWASWYGPRHIKNINAFNKWDELNRQGRKIFGVASSDSHSLAFAAYTTVLSETRSAQGIANGYRARNMYGTNGPEISFSAGGAIMGGEISVTAGQTITVSMQGEYTHALEKLILIKNGGVIFEKTIDADNFDEVFSVQVSPGDFIRMELEGKTTDALGFESGIHTDNHGFFTTAPFAFSNPIFFC